jgi:hypothetical protein
MWKEATAASRPIRDAALPHVDRMGTERQLQVRGVRVQKRSTHPAVVGKTPKLAKVDQRLLGQTKRVESLKKVTVYFTQRHYFQVGLISQAWTQRQLMECVLPSSYGKQPLEPSPRPSRGSLATKPMPSALVLRGADGIAGFKHALRTARRLVRPCSSCITT